MRQTVVCLLVLGLSAGCDAVKVAKGQVEDPRGAPVAGASVSLQRKGGARREAESDKEGKFSVSVIYGPGKAEFTLAVSKPGFKPFSRVLTTDGPVQEQVTAVLERAEP
jgi:hypothetical protein